MLGYPCWVGGRGSEAGALAVRICVWATEKHGRVEWWLRSNWNQHEYGHAVKRKCCHHFGPKALVFWCDYTSSFWVLLESVSAFSSRAVCPLEQPSYMGLRQRTAARCCSRGACAEAMPVWKSVLESTCRWSCFRDKTCDFCLFNYLFFLPGFLPTEQPGEREPKTTIKDPMGSSSQPPSSWRKMSCYTS